MGLASAGHWSPASLAGLEALVRTADDCDLFRVDPVRYAANAGLPEADTIDLLFHATEVGLCERKLR